jgi:16S rRNA (adenine1518-N6/adenine1519-N6)-dimethyltransferase
MFQKEFAQKLAAKPGTKDYCFITCFFQYYFKITKHYTVPASAFSPRPKIDSQFIKIEHAEKGGLTGLQEAFMLKLIRQAFMYRRKKIINALGAFTDLPDFSEILAQASINANDRPDALSLKQYAALTKLLQKR